MEIFYAQAKLLIVEILTVVSDYSRMVGLDVFGGVH